MPLMHLDACLQIAVAGSVNSSEGWLKLVFQVRGGGYVTCF